MDTHPCDVCGNTEKNLVDGNYYCVECGTQDTNVKETLIEQHEIAEGIFGVASTKRYTVATEETLNASGEVLKWHAFNCILVGLADELISLGALPSFKMKLLWIWTRYIKKYQVKEEYRATQDQCNETSTFDIEEINEDEEALNNDMLDDELIKEENEETRKHKDIKIINRGVIMAMLYIALNLDGSEIQLSHLCRFVREGRLSLFNFLKFVPKEINFHLIPNYKSCYVFHDFLQPRAVRGYATTLYMKLKLGSPKMPDMRKIIDTFIVELCLPNDIRDLVISLMDLIPCNFLIISNVAVKNLLHVPDYEGIAMSYILIAMKMCFGLDCDYEIKFSDAVEHINDEKKHPKSYKLGAYSEPTDRLFSFREWSYYMQIRKMMLCKYYLPMGRKYHQYIDDLALLQKENKPNVDSTDLITELTMNLLNNIPNDFDEQTIPINEFPGSLTPMCTYTDVVLQFIQDPDMRLLLSEDFSQYSLEYPTYLKDTDNMYIGLSESNKNINPYPTGYLKEMHFNFNMVYVRNCENKNWLKTNPPTADHVKIVKENDNVDDDDESESIIENSSSIGDNEVLNVNDTIFETIDEEDPTKCIFDDDFKGVFLTVEEEDIYNNIYNDEYTNDQNDEFTNSVDVKECFNRMKSESSDSGTYCQFNPETFNSAQIIKELILKACKDYKIPIPECYKNKCPGSRKRKPNVKNDETEKSATKRKRKKYVSDNNIYKKLLTDYYHCLENDIMNKLSEHVQSVVQTLGLDQSESTLNQQLNNEPSEPLANEQTNSMDNSVVETNNVDVEMNDQDEQVGFIENYHPKFNDKVYDLKQLYVKIIEEKKSENLFNAFDDLELNKIIDEQLQNIETSNKLELTDDDDKSTVIIDSTFSDHVTALDETTCKQEVKFKIKEEHIKMEPLIKHPENIKEMKYWFRHYDKALVAGKIYFSKRFQLELNDNFPNSFSFVLRECAAILESPTLLLYLKMKKLEKMIMSSLKTYE